MERKIGEEFDYNGQKLKVVETIMGTCAGCFFKGDCNHNVKAVVGICYANVRADKRQVVFVKVAQVSNEEPQKQELNLCEVLRDCPDGMPFWSPMLGDVTFMCVNGEYVTVEDKNKNSWDINSDSTLTIGGVHGVKSEEPMLFPSRDQRDWSKWKLPKPKFDPKSLKAFDKVLVNHDDIWKVDFFSHICQYEPNGWCQCIGDSYYICIPYNDDTKHLIGTKDEAPEFYRYWVE